MKKAIFILSCVLFCCKSVFSQRFGGSLIGEIYYYTTWYEYDYFKYYYNLYRFTDYGKSVEFMQVTDPSNSNGVCFDNVLIDYSPGVLYNIESSTRKLQLSTDFGNNWMNVDEMGAVSIGTRYWVFANTPSEIIKKNNHGSFISYNNGHIFDTLPVANLFGTAGWNHGEFFGWNMEQPKQFYYTNNFYETYEIISIPDSIWTLYGDGFVTGPLEGDLYLLQSPSSFSRRIVHSDNYGLDFQILMEFDSIEVDELNYPGRRSWAFLVDREPGVFYSFTSECPYASPQDGTTVRIKYYRSYGDTLVTTYVHHFIPDWFSHHSPVMDCEIESCGENNVTIHWNEPELRLEEVLVGYQVYRGETLVTEDLISETEYTDNYSGGGHLNYHVLAVYNDGETSKSYNIVYCEQTEGLDENEAGNDSITLSPNPTSDLVRIEGNVVTEIQVYNILGQLVKTTKNANEINLKELPQGVYLLRITDENGANTTRKVVVG